MPLRRPRKWNPVAVKIRVLDTEDCGIDPDFYALRERSVNEILPWDMIQLETPRSFLLKEYERYR